VRARHQQKRLTTTTTHNHTQMKRDVGADVSVLVQNAGIVAGKPFLQGEDAYSQRTMEVNAMAHFWTIKVRGWV
jgi:short-subunit dehydrogenase